MHWLWRYFITATQQALQSCNITLSTLLIDTWFCCFLFFPCISAILCAFFICLGVGGKGFGVIPEISDELPKNVEKSASQYLSLKDKMIAISSYQGTQSVIELIASDYWPDNGVMMVLVPRWHQISTLITRKRSVSRRFHTLSSSIRSLYHFIHNIHYTSIHFQPRSWQCCLLPSYPQIQPVQQRWSRSRLASSLTALTKGGQTTTSTTAAMAT